MHMLTSLLGLTTRVRIDWRSFDDDVIHALYCRTIMVDSSGWLYKNIIMIVIREC